MSHDVDPSAFPVRCLRVRDVDLAFVHAGLGGTPLLLLHGWPETKRIWWRNIGGLLTAGFEVIAPDLRGFGDSDPAPDGAYDVAACSMDVAALLAVLGHKRCVVCGGDFGGVVAQDLSLRSPGLVDRMLLFNTIPPFSFEAYEREGLAPFPVTELEHFQRHGLHADQLIEGLGTAEACGEYVASVYGTDGWVGQEPLDEPSVQFMAEPFAGTEALRRSLHLYSYAFGVPASEPPRLFEPNPTPTIVLYGPEDPVVPPLFVDQMRLAFPNAIGPFVLPGVGHFVQWERSAVVNQMLAWLATEVRFGQGDPSDPTGVGLTRGFRARILE
ncbi:MAG TPA: alpha/beta hydrolase [Actinomycetota bacterium]|jgi:pimeloyl-ACP methyl ester carboxylesterase|nr:alpha/beta hydrolase [Actinomycetota bacterium]